MRLYAFPYPLSHSTLPPPSPPPSHPLLPPNPFPLPIHHTTVSPTPFPPSPLLLPKRNRKEKRLSLTPTNPLLLLELSPSPSSLFFPSPYQTSAHHPPLPPHPLLLFSPPLHPPTKTFLTPESPPNPVMFLN